MSRRTLFHYTSEAGLRGILESGVIFPSMASKNPNDVRHGEGQYFSDIEPETFTPSKLSQIFLGLPFQGRRFTHFLEVDVSDLNVIEGRPGVLVVPNVVPVSIIGKVVRTGLTRRVSRGGV